METDRIATAFLKRKRNPGAATALATQCCRNAAVQGEAEGQFRPGPAAFNGVSVALERKQPRRWIGKDTQQPDPRAECLLRLTDFSGENLPADRNRGFRGTRLVTGWFRETSAHGNADGEYELTWPHEHGQTVPLATATSVRECHKTVEQSLPDARLNNGLDYERGEDVPHDEVLATMLADLPAANGRKTVRRMSTVEIAEALPTCSTIAVVPVAHQCHGQPTDRSQFTCRCSPAVRIATTATALSSTRTATASTAGCRPNLTRSPITRSPPARRADRLPTSLAIPSNSFR